MRTTISSFYLYKTEIKDGFSQVRSHEFEILEGSFAIEFLLGEGIHMRESQVQLLLIGKAKSTQIGRLGKDVAQFDMIVFQAALLSGLHGITVKDCGTAIAQIIFLLEPFRIDELGAAVSEKNLDILGEKLVSKQIMKFIHTGHHISGGLGFMEESQKYAKGDELEGLDERAVGNVVVNGIHLCHKTIRVVLAISEVVNVFSSVEIAIIVPFLKYCLLIFGKLSAGFASQVEIADS